MFHVAPSDAMRRDAVAAAHVDGNATVVAWQPTLVRFGADTLNRRFKARFGHPMTADAWTAWLATKILWESALRVNAGDPKMLIEYLSRETTQFDGHKGVPLSFRAWDRQLRQPLFVVNDNKSIEVPIAPASHDPPPARDLLDQLGTGAANSACHVRS
jgi:ABC transporter substrate binding protein (PQQ-dependent alcohol dehydrogenase system)